MVRVIVLLFVSPTSTASNELALSACSPHIQLSLCPVFGNRISLPYPDKGIPKIGDPRPAKRLSSRTFRLSPKSALKASLAGGTLTVRIRY